jgi:hypothetical protein
MPVPVQGTWSCPMMAGAAGAGDEAAAPRALQSRKVIN